MGIPAAFRWLSQKYPKIVSPVIEEQPTEVDGIQIPVDTTRPNPNGEEFDNLYLDMNGIVHPCSHPEDRPPPATEEEMMLEVFKYTERVVKMVRPRKLLMIAVDGVAPRAKMNQQRSRRFRSAQEAKEKDDDREEFLKLLKKGAGDKVDAGIEGTIVKKTWDSNAITPGTPFMDILALSLRYWCAYKLNTDPAWAKVKVIISDATVPGEGEHKIMQFIRSQRSSPEHNPNTRHVIYGLDADLIMLGIATHEPHFRVLREDVFFQESKSRGCRICGQEGHRAEECRGQAKLKDGNFDEKDSAHPLKPFIWLHVDIFREYLEVELYVLDQPFPFDLERALDDWVFMCFFVGNDFLPHLPSLEIRDNGIDTLLTIWRESIPSMGGYVTKDGHVNLERAQYILSGLAKQEDAIFRRRRQAEMKREKNAKRRKTEESNRYRQPDSRNQQEDGVRTKSAADLGISAQDVRIAKSLPPPGLPLFEPGNITREARDMTHDMVVNRSAVFHANQANKSAAAALKSQLLNGISTASDSLPTADGDGTAPSDSTTVSTPHKRKADALDTDDAGTPSRISPNPTPSGDTSGVVEEADNVRLWEEGYASRYYARKFSVSPDNISFRHEVAKAYVEGLAWVLLYYFQGCPSWTWYYPYHYAPFAADFVDMASMKISFDQGKAFKPFEQLMGVLPAASRHTIPTPFHSLMTDEESEIIDFYPEDFPIDLNGKKFAWQGVALLPFIDSERLLKAMATRYGMLTEEDHRRNELGRDVLLVCDVHPLYDEVAGKLYGKKKEKKEKKEETQETKKNDKKGEGKVELNPRVSEGLAGLVEKDDSKLPRSELVCPVKVDGFGDLEEDRTISLHYDMPNPGHIHKSMLLRGVKFNPRALDHADKEGIKYRAHNSGGSYGGAPLRGGYNNPSHGRGGGRHGGGGHPHGQSRGNSSQQYQGGYNGYHKSPAPGGFAQGNGSHRGGGASRGGSYGNGYGYGNGNGSSGSAPATGHPPHGYPPAQGYPHAQGYPPAQGYAAGYPPAPGTSSVRGRGQGAFGGYSHGQSGAPPPRGGYTPAPRPGPRY